MSGEVSVYTPSDGIIHVIPPPRYDSPEVTPRRRRSSFTCGEEAARERRVKSVCRLSAEYIYRTPSRSSSEEYQVSSRSSSCGVDGTWIIYADGTMNMEDIHEQDLISRFRYFNQDPIDTITVDCMRQDFLQAIAPLRSRTTSLGSAISALRVLDPIDNLYFVNFKLEDVTTKELDELLDKLDVIERDHLESMSKGYNEDDVEHLYNNVERVLYADTPVNKYTPLLTGRFDVSIHLFADCMKEYPTYVAHRWLQDNCKRSELYVLYELDYSLDLHRTGCDTSLLARQLVLLTPELGKRQLSLLAAMLGVRHAYFDNEGYVSRILPGDEKYSGKLWIDHYKKVLQKHFGTIPASLYLFTDTRTANDCIFMGSYEH